MVAFTDPYVLAQLAGVLEDRQAVVPSLLQTHFGNVVEYSTEFIPMDKIMPDSRISMYVAAEATAPVHTARGYDTKVYYPWYWKEKATIDENNIRKRRAGEAFNAALSPGARAVRLMLDNMEAIKDKRTRLFELTARDIMLYGVCNGASAKHPTAVIDFEPFIATHATTTGSATATVPAGQAVALNSGRANRANLTATDVTGPSGQVIPGAIVSNREWGGTSDTPLKDMQAMFDAAYEEVGVIYMDTDAFNILAAETLFDKQVKAYAVPGAVNVFDEIPKQTSKEGIKILGFWRGVIPIVDYSATYQPTNVAQAEVSDTANLRYLPKGWVVMMPRQNYGIKTFGMIQHAGARYRSMDIFWNDWITEEEGTPWLQGQSAPNFLHSKIGSTVAWKVM